MRPEDDEEESDESSSMSMKEIKVGSRLKFRVEKVNREDDRVVLLVGSLLGKGCGPVDSSRQGDDDEETINGTDAAAEDDHDVVPRRVDLVGTGLHLEAARECRAEWASHANLVIHREYCVVEIRLADLPQARDVVEDLF